MKKEVNNIAYLLGTVIAACLVIFPSAIILGFAFKLMIFIIEL